MDDAAQDGAEHRTVNTGGGHYFAGDIRVYGGDFVAGNKIVLTPEVLKQLMPEPYAPPELPPMGDGLPLHADPPPGSRMLPGLGINRVFTGRQSDLAKLAEALLYQPRGQAETVSTPVVSVSQPHGISGMGGIGKTQLAVEFCYRYGQYFHGVHWINASTPETLASEIVACGSQMGLLQWPEKFPEQLMLTLQVWRSRGPRLVVLDNLESAEALQDWLPALSPARILITSRNPEWPADLGVMAHRLGVLPRQDSIALLRKLATRLKDAAEGELSMLAERLGDLPLALDLAGRYLQGRARLTIAGYLGEIDQAENDLQHTSLLDWTEHSPTKHETSLAATFLLSWRQLEGDGDADVLARQVFCACGYCAPNTLIPTALLMPAVKSDEQGFDARYDRATGRLHALGLLDVSEAGALIHPLLAQFARLQDGQGDESMLMRLVDALDKLNSEARGSGIARRFEPYRNHMASAAEALLKVDKSEAARLFNSLGYLLKAMGDLAGARPYLEQALEIRREALGEKHPDMATSLNNLGTLLYQMGDLAGARPYYEQALAIYREALGKKHPSTAQSLNNLGMLLKAMGDLAGARPYLEQALEIQREALGEKHPSMATSLNNLGTLLYQMGDLAGARPYLEQALEIRREALGEKHPDTAQSLNNMGMLLYQMGDLAGARPYLEQALEIRREALGEKHPDTAQSLNNMGMLLYQMGDLAGARPYYEQALEILKTILPAGHPNIRTVQNNLASLAKSRQRTAPVPSLREWFNGILRKLFK